MIKKVLIVFFAVCFCSALFSACGKKSGDDNDTGKQNEVLVFLIGGQSNAVGNGYLDDLPGEECKAYPGIYFYAGGNVAPAAKEKLIRVTGISGLGTDASSFGMELGMAKMFAQAQEEDGKARAIIKCAFNGSSIKSSAQFGDWNVTGDGEGNGGNYAEFLRVVQAGLAELTEEGLQPVLAGFAWHQGESDSALADYGVRLKKLRDKAREDMEAPEMLFLMGELAEQNYGSNNMVNTAITALQKQDPERSAVIACGNLAPRCTQAQAGKAPYHANDYLHWSGENMLRIGEMYAEKFLEMQ